MIYFDPCSPSILPAIVVGYEVSESNLARINMAQDVDNWLVTLTQQAGGLCMQYSSVTGAVLPLGINAQHGNCNQSQIETLLTGFEAMAESPDIEVLSQKYPVLKDLCLTTGEPYNSAQLLALDQYLASYLSLPHIDSGIEAFVRFVDTDPTAFFSEFKMLSFELGAQYYINRPGCLPANYARHADVGELELSHDVKFSAAIVDKLKSFAQDVLGLTPEVSAPRCFLLWQNSD